MNWYNMTKGEVVEELETSEGGISSDEVERRRKVFGLNQLDEAERPSMILMFLAQFKDFMVVVLLAATLISGLLGEYLDAIAIILIILMNGILGFVQERKAEKSLQALKQLSSPKMKVLRDGDWTIIPALEAVVGDIVRIESGDRIGADLRLLTCQGLQIEESALTGESLPVNKHPEAIRDEQPGPGDQQNMGFMGTLVTKGKGVGVVTATGMKTEMGKIAHLIQSADTMETPLQNRLEQLGKVLIAAALLLTALVVVLGIIQGRDVYSMFLAGVSLAVAAIPEGLPAIVTIALAIGMQKMSKRKAIVRKLPSVETLGCATVICSDKTGTLTQNKMMVTKLWAGGETWDVTGSGYSPYGDFFKGNTRVYSDEERSLKQLLTFGLLCSNARVMEKSGEYVLDGDPTEGALVAAAMKAGLTEDVREEEFTIIQEFPFDSNRKMMSIVVEDSVGKRYVIAKGAPDIVLKQCESVLWSEKKAPLRKSYEREIQEQLNAFGELALRTIAVAFKPIQNEDNMLHSVQAESRLTFVGLEGMIDPPREEVKQAVADCKTAGIKTIMITGDHVTTAKAIALNLGILPERGKVMEGSKLSSLSVEELENQVEEIYVFARVSPEHKLKIVKALQNRGHIVAMTGDGVNDAPAIKASNIGISMGVTGTDVAKESSSLILSDDNFTTIRAAVEEGRNIYENIRKFIRYMLASNVGEILVMLFAILLMLPLPLVPIQILWVNLVTDGLPAMALGLDPAEGNVMRRDPRKPKEGVFARGLGWKIISRGIMIGACTLAAFMICYSENPNDLVQAQTVAFSTLVLAQLIHVFDCRSERSIFHRNPFENKALVLAVLSSVGLLLAVIYYEPLQPIFHTTYLSMREWMLILVFSSIPTFLLAGTTFFKRQRRRG
ncbi:calcium-translocating P-type ATPase, SERCA-type [Bacillus hwajinpoensis]|uniref:P-type Ca(2+) transporter n=1 Tax=Guptibacillus hwajinpoensis TaxID=208199 RepID=A0A845EYX5_9BACL|nr:calcium-translocating P-type ATPase, SERCA-type [Pseudalkalibacillus hwajinpoensis]MYL63729.1 calcium-translocating P-type ATPase, SERCA-type [Pseudalkalibacillus hwajinpoensis]